MAVRSLQEALAVLERLERSQLEELALEYVQSHARLCRLAAGVEHGEESHASDAELAERVRDLSEEQLAELLAPAARLSMIACQTSP